MKFKKAGSILGWGLILALVVNLSMWVPGARAASPMEGVKGLIEQVQNIIQTNSAKSQRLDLLEKLSNKHLDFQEMAKRSLGSTWGTLSAGQKTEFVQLISQLLKASYANHLDGFVKTKLNFLGESCDGDHAEVRLVINRPNDRIPVNIQLLQKPGGWMIYDMNIDGVSMVSNYKGQFQRAIQLTSYKSLVALLKVKLKAETLG